MNEGGEHIRVYLVVILIGYFDAPYKERDYVLLVDVAIFRDCLMESTDNVNELLEIGIGNRESGEVGYCIDKRGEEGDYFDLELVR